METMFLLPEDGWYQISAKGEFPHKATGLLQVVDDAACGSIVDAFQKSATTPNFPGVLVDFDHFSLDTEKPSEAAGWITAIETRPDGLWAQIRWTDKGESAVRGGRYRFVSPVWNRTDCEEMGETKVRPLKLCNAALTNDPNIPGMMPLSNRAAPKTVEAPKPRPVVRLTNRAATDFVRGLHFAHGAYVHPTEPRVTILNRIEDDDQRRAFFAKMGGRGGGGWGGGGGGSGGGDAPKQAESIGIHESPRRSMDRMNELQRQIDDLEASRPTPPAAPDYSQTDTRALQRELLAQGKGPNEVLPAVRAAEERNLAIRQANRELRAKAKKLYPGNADAQKRYMERERTREQRAYEKAVAAVHSENQKIDEQLAKLSNEKNIEAIRAYEEMNRSAIRMMKADTAQAARDARAAEQRRKAEIQADLARAKAEAKAKTAAPADDPVRQYRSQRAREKTYWDAVIRGDYDAAKTMFPDADHDSNIEAVETQKQFLAGNDREKRSAQANLAELRSMRP